MKADREWIVRAAQDRAKGDPRLDVEDEPAVEEIDGTYWVAAWVLVTPEEADDARCSAGERQDESNIYWQHSQ